MYDILQLNDMLVPELQDIATEQNISNPKKLDKQELISQILNNQSAMNTAENNNIEGEKPKRKRIRKPLEEVDNKESQQQVPEEKPKPEIRIKKSESFIEKKKFVKKHVDELPDEGNIEEADIEKSLEDS
ncbi:MAG: Rho termination factor N-terminal domain-containing protein, partial [Ginsengibacter sp.]